MPVRANGRVHARGAVPAIEPVPDDGVIRSGVHLRDNGPGSVTDLVLPTNPVQATAEAQGPVRARAPVRAQGGLQPRSGRQDPGNARALVSVPGRISVPGLVSVRAAGRRGRATPRGAAVPPGGQRRPVVVRGRMDRPLVVMIVRSRMPGGRKARGRAGRGTAAPAVATADAEITAARMATAGTRGPAAIGSPTAVAARPARAGMPTGDTRTGHGAVREAVSLQAQVRVLGPVNAERRPVVEPAVLPRPDAHFRAAGREVHVLTSGGTSPQRARVVVRRCPLPGVRTGIAAARTRRDLGYPSSLRGWTNRPSRVTYEPR